MASPLWMIRFAGAAFACFAWFDAVAWHFLPLTPYFIRFASVFFVLGLLFSLLCFIAAIRVVASPARTRAQISLSTSMVLVVVLNCAVALYGTRYI
jgi:hypothetical protein